MVYFKTQKCSGFVATTHSHVGRDFCSHLIQPSGPIAFSDKELTLALSMVSGVQLRK